MKDLHDDVKRWDEIHKKTHQLEEKPSAYAVEKEKLFPRNCLVVEVGGGTGNDALYFLQKGHSVVILDISEFALKVAQEKAAKLNLSEKLATKQVDFGLHQLPIKDASVDVVFSRISLHYFDSSHTTKLFADVYKMLKPGGVAYLTFKSPDDPGEMEYLQNSATLFEPNVFIENGQLRSRFTIEQLKTMLQNAGIANASVSLYKEQLSADQPGPSSVLMQNEIVFKK